MKIFIYTLDFASVCETRIKIVYKPGLCRPLSYTMLDFVTTKQVNKI